MFQRLLIIWLPIFLAGTAVLLAVYAAVQQDIRLGANDPQIQMAEDGAAFLSKGYAPAALTNNSHVDMALSLSPFVIVYDDNGKVVSSSGYLNDQVPVPPTGVFDYARANAEDRLTWQPAPNIRLAAVFRRFDGKESGFIAVGRSLREVESRESQLTYIIGAAWIGMFLISLFSVLATGSIGYKNS